MFKGVRAINVKYPLFEPTSTKVKLFLSDSLNDCVKYFVSNGAQIPCF